MAGYAILDPNCNFLVQVYTGDFARPTHVWCNIERTGQSFAEACHQVIFLQAAHENLFQMESFMVWLSNLACLLSFQQELFQVDQGVNIYTS